MKRYWPTGAITLPLERYSVRLALDDPERAFIHSVLATLDALPITEGPSSAPEPPSGLGGT